MISSINFAPDFMIIYVIPPLKQRVNEDFLVHTSVYFSEVVHVELPDEGTPILMPEVTPQHYINEFIFIFNDKFCSIDAEVDDVRVFLHYNGGTLMMRVSFWMKSGTWEE